jgi:hypothetical protein
MTDMMKVWKQHINAIDEMITNTDLQKDGRIKQLCQKKYYLELAYLRCLGEKI